MNVFVPVGNQFIFALRQPDHAKNADQDHNQNKDELKA
jgi:hypothetical protein